MSTEDKINYINIVLIALSLVAAWIFPFQLFVIVYAVLGPLHYLTEISWLHDRKYFSQAKGSSLLWALAAVFTIVTLAAPVLGVYLQKVSLCQHLTGQIIFTAFALSALALTDRGEAINARNVAIVLGLSSLVVLVPFCDLFFSVYLVTLVHVFLFTWFFMLSGSLKSGRQSGFLALAVLTLCAILCLVPSGSSIAPVAVPQAVMNNLQLFGRLDLFTAKLLGWQNPEQVTALMRFIAFAYTYHYLNWFSKTHLIRWHKVTSARLSLIVVLYVGSLAVYAIDWALGFKVLLFLSVGHVFLELPLALKTIVGLPNQCGQALLKKQNQTLKAQRCAS